MDTSEAIKIIEALASGIDPITGELFQENSSYNNPKVIRALFLSSKALNSLKDRERRERVLPENAGKPWTPDEEQMLLEAFDLDINVKGLAKRHSRTPGAITARLVRLGRISERSEELGRAKHSFAPTRKSP
ncbi:MAG: hypothetical protein IH860_03565 [Chloroflexi bacterium]|nr:hypothetical protein [Chloroflexota bacterium]